MREIKEYIKSTFVSADKFNSQVLNEVLAELGYKKELPEPKQPQG